MANNKTKTQPGENMKLQEIKNKLSEKVMNLVFQNMDAGADYETAKEQAINYLELEYPWIINVICAD